MRPGLGRGRLPTAEYAIFWSNQVVSDKAQGVKTTTGHPLLRGYSIARHLFYIPSFCIMRKDAAALVRRAQVHVPKSSIFCQVGHEKQSLVNILEVPNVLVIIRNAIFDLDR